MKDELSRWFVVVVNVSWVAVISLFFLQAEDGIRDLVRSRGLGDVYKRQAMPRARHRPRTDCDEGQTLLTDMNAVATSVYCCLLYTSDAADERSSVDLGGRRIIKKKKSEAAGTDTNNDNTEARRREMNV